MSELSADVDSRGVARFMDIGIDAAIGDAVFKPDLSDSPGFVSSTGSKTVPGRPRTGPMTLSC